MAMCDVEATMGASGEEDSEKYISTVFDLRRSVSLSSIDGLKVGRTSVPSMMDGLSPIQRTVLFCAFQMNLVKELEVDRFAGHVTYRSRHPHSRASIQNVIIGMAQDFVGSNNINLFQPRGFFGTRRMGGKDHGKANHIYTVLSPITRFIFRKEDDNILEYLHEDRNDDNILEYLDEDRNDIGPTWYLPIIPMCLINGNERIGKEWCPNITCYNPRDIIDNIRRILENKELKFMIPWYRGFKGSIERLSSNENRDIYVTTGVMEKDVSGNTIKVTELPLWKWTEDFRNCLEEHMLEFSDRSYTEDVEFEISFKHKVEKDLMRLTKSNLTTTFATRMELVDANGHIKNYEMAEQILKEFCIHRLQYYEKRKEYKLKKLEEKLSKLENTLNYVSKCISREIDMFTKTEDVIGQLKQKGFAMFRNSKSEEPSFDYLLKLPVITILTSEKLEKLSFDKEKTRDKISQLKKETKESLWMKDLDALETELNSQLL